MSLRVIGINHKTAPVAIREKVAFSPDGLTETLSEINFDIENTNKENEVIILSTCNRTEIYTYSNYTEDQIISWLAQKDGMDNQSVKEYIYNHIDDEAIKHVMRVASGLDSMSVIEDNMKSRQEAALQGEEMIAEEVESFMGWMRAQDQMSLIKSYRDKISTIQDETLDKALKLLKKCQLEPIVIEYKKYIQIIDDKETAEEMLNDPELKDMAKEELAEIKDSLEEFELTLQKLIAPKDPA
ncbi:Glutamyl-tRNA reductase [Nymphon striatum]|nr:Glutamyl-tRNA reductase [Nymphon striatum]